MTPSLTPDLTELEQLLEKAMPAPWCGALLFEENHTEANYDLTDALVNAAPSLITAARERDELKAESQILGKVSEVVIDAREGESGFWRTCPGCHESEDGHDVGHYPFSKAFNVKLGAGCRECGGIGALWDTTDYGEVAEFMLADMRADDEHRAELTVVTAQRDEAIRRVEEVERENARPRDECWDCAGSGQDADAPFGKCIPCGGSGQRSLTDELRKVRQWLNDVPAAGTPGTILQMRRIDRILVAVSKANSERDQAKSALEDLQGEVGRTDRHRFGSPPEPVANPSADWCDSYADWYYQGKG